MKGRCLARPWLTLAAALAFQILAYISQIDWCSRQVQQHVQTRAKAPENTCHELTPAVTELQEWVKADLQSG